MSVHASNANLGEDLRRERALWRRDDAAPPLCAAPARFGEAGISAGEDARYKAWITPWRGATREHEAVHLAKALGWFSIALGLTEIVAPGRLSGWLGMPEKRAVVGAFGAREIGTGVAILMQRSPAGAAHWVRARVLGDIADIAALATGLSGDNPKRVRVGLAIGLVAAVTLADVFCAAVLSEH